MAERRQALVEEGAHPFADAPPEHDRQRDKGDVGHDRNEDCPHRSNRARENVFCKPELGLVDLPGIEGLLDQRDEVILALGLFLRRLALAAVGAEREGESQTPPGHLVEGLRE